MVISNRKNGNSEILVKEIMNSIPEECSYELIRLTDLQIKPCTGCYHCLKPDTECVLNDDFNFVMDKMKRADALVIGFPIYTLGPHGYYKMLSDRLIGAFKYAEYTSGKPCIIVSPYGRKGWEGYAKTAALAMPRLLQLKMIDYWQVHAAMPGESLINQRSLEYAQKLGVRLFNSDSYTPGIRECPYCGSDLFRLCSDNRIECPLCNAKGILRDDNLPYFSNPEDFRFSADHILDHFAGFLAEQKKAFKLEKARLKEVQDKYRDIDWWIKP